VISHKSFLIDSELRSSGESKSQHSDGIRILRNYEYKEYWYTANCELLLKLQNKSSKEPEENS